MACMECGQEHATAICPALFPQQHYPLFAPPEPPVDLVRELADHSRAVRELTGVIRELVAELRKDKQ